MDCGHSGLGVRKGAWTDEEDDLLRKCIKKHGERKWVQVPMRAGLNRCRKSCRLRWLNYLRPNINRGNFLEDEVDLIIRLHRLLGNRWSLIAGRLPGRTANDIKNYWNSHISKRVSKQTKGMQSQVKSTKVIRPQPRTVSPNSKWLIGNGSSTIQTQLQQVPNNSTPPEDQESSVSWWKSLLAEEEETMKEMGTRRLTSWEGGPGDQVMADCYGVDKTDQKKSQEEDDQLMGGAFEEETLKEMGTWPLTSWEGGPGDQDTADCFGVEETDQRNSNEEDDLLMFGDWEENMSLDMDLFVL